MSVRCEHYLILGTRIEVPKDKLDQFSEEWSNRDLDFPWCGKGAKGKIGILWDGMGCRYILAGRCLAVADDEGNNSFEIMEIRTPELIAISEVWEWIDNERLREYTAGPVKMFLVSHYH